MTVTPIRPAPVLRPETYTDGLGELIRSYRLYLGLTQRAMADRVNKNMRDYQRIENGQEACPPGFLGIVEALADVFEVHVDAVIDAAKEQGGIRIEADSDPAYEWERSVAGRAGVVVATLDDSPEIILVSPDRSVRSR
jgi:transcriptional regulator with XRE-family HTH domain